jgi:hypothetical protein
MPTDLVIPTLPSRDLTETLAFYRSLDGLFRELAAKGLPAEGSGNLLRVGWPV